MKTNKIWMIIGISSFSIVLGFLIGSSNSPVIGAALSSIFGLAVALLGLLESDDNNRFKLNYAKLKFSGKILFTFSILLLVGVIAGEYYRNDKISFLRESHSFPWDNAPPNSTYEALDWIITSQKLKQLGYSKEQIRSLYQIRLKEIVKYRNDSPGRTEGDEDIYGFEKKDETGYVKSSPFYDFIPSATIESAKTTRGPASEE